MNKHAQDYATEFKARYERAMLLEIETLLAEYPEANQRIFRRMYPNGPTVEQMPLAFGQIMATPKGKDDG